MGALFSKKKRRRDGAEDGGESSSSPADEDIPSILTKISLFGVDGCGKEILCESVAGNRDGYFMTEHRALGRLAQFTVSVFPGQPSSSAHFRGSMGLLVVFDPTVPKSFDVALEILDFMGQSAMRNHVKFLVANVRSPSGEKALIDGIDILGEAKNRNARFIQLDCSNPEASTTLMNNLFESVIDSIVNAPPVHVIS